MKRLFPLVLLIAAACDDQFGPNQWIDRPDTLTLFSASRSAYIGLPSALDIAADPVATLPLEIPGATGNWDFVVADHGGVLSLIPASAFPGLESLRSRIAVLEGRDFKTLEEAPGDTLRYTSQPVPLRTGVVYVLRSRKAGCGYTSGYRYAKMRSVTIDQPRGTYSFEIIRNPYCDDRALVPPKE